MTRARACGECESWERVLALRLQVGYDPPAHRWTRGGWGRASVHQKPLVVRVSTCSCESEQSAGKMSLSSGTVSPVDAAAAEDDASPIRWPFFGFVDLFSTIARAASTHRAKMRNISI